MENENVVQFPTKLDNLAVKINDTIVKRKNHEEGWIDATIDLCVYLAEARAEHPSNEKFGDWFDANIVGITRHDREAAITMGQNIELAREILQKTNRTSLQHTCNEEFVPELKRRLPHVRDTAFPNQNENEVAPEPVAPKPDPMAPKPEPVEPKPKATRITPETQKAKAAYTRLKAEGKETTQTTVAREAGVHRSVAEKVIAADKAEAKAKEDEKARLKKAKEDADAKLADYEQNVVEPYKKTLPLPFRIKFEKEIAQFRELLKHHRREVLEYEANKWKEEIGLNDLSAELSKIQHTLSYPRNSVMREAEYKKILMCLHPDGVKARTVEQLSEAFQIFAKYKLKITNSDEEKENVRLELLKKLKRPLPASVEEMIANRMTKTKG